MGVAKARSHAERNWDDTTVDSGTETRTHNSVNELTARTPSGQSQITLSYDAAGNLTQDGDADGDHKYTWDYRNRLVKVEEKQSGQWNTIAECRYDARNRRIRRLVTNKGGLNGVTRFLWGGGLSVAASRRPGDAGIGRAGQGLDWQCLEKEDGSGNLVARYTYAPGYIDGVAVQERDLNSDDDFADTNEVVYYHSNTLFSVYALSNASESVVERYRYDAYGGCTVLDADGSADSDGLSDVGNPYAFTGRRLDAETGLIQYRNRYLDTCLGRFISRDPARRSTRRAYEYGDSAPLQRGDPSGLGPIYGAGGDCRHREVPETVWGSWQKVGSSYWVTVAEFKDGWHCYPTVKWNMALWTPWDPPIGGSLLGFWTCVWKCRRTVTTLLEKLQDYELVNLYRRWMVKECCEGGDWVEKDRTLVEQASHTAEKTLLIDLAFDCDVQNEEVDTGRIEAWPLGFGIYFWPVGKEEALSICMTDPQYALDEEADLPE